MIVSPPRSGSTVVYQTLVRAIPSVYISNLHMCFPSLATRFLLKRNMLGIGLSEFKNYYGYTPSINDVNEGNLLVDDLLKGDANVNMVRNRFLRFIDDMGGKSERPLIFKNVRAYANIYRLHEAVPEMIFLRIKRATEQIIYSEVSGYRELGTFHPIPKKLANVKIDNPVHFAVRQILEIERELEEQKKKINPAVWLEWTYEDFCSKTLPMIMNLASYLNIPTHAIRKELLPNRLTASIKTVAQEEMKQIITMINYEKCDKNACSDHD